MRGFALHRPLLLSALLGGAIGLLFAVLLAKRATSAGAGLIWGLGSGFTIWLLMPARLLPLLIGGGGMNSMLPDARFQFPQLVADLLCLGMPHWARPWPLRFCAKQLRSTALPLGPRDRRRRTCRHI